MITRDMVNGLGRAVAAALGVFGVYFIIVVAALALFGVAATRTDLFATFTVLYWFVLAPIVLFLVGRLMPTGTKQD